ncbi:hypothetical protein BCR33DRAFT_789021 [Rhizoclosmatium globosum]|uniref:Uncharacterized protein n=1 Tax=Rhizoclosmatium globosum TaxID=329046 RepID=A0A1Y2BUL6_9FUNG|nr:hypothetical protein BCR33DRAFT_789021 [Rhizoclosmatium globosum]|eukprot:ORY38449.1 hypothetical protein BCR33DRAFT_789021 [Rhizoclosmatium globosum]
MLQCRNRAVQQMLAPPSEPLKFKDKLIKTVANALGIGKFVVLASTIGNAIVEFYVT